MIFTGIGVLLSASTILSIAFGSHSQIRDLIDSTRSCGEQGHSRGAVRSHRMVLFTTRNIYERVTDYGNDGDNHADISGGSKDLWYRDEGAKARISK